jgi:hypothetical protein
MLNLQWRRCGDDGHFCSLQNLDLSTITDKVGVYVIWHEGNPSRVVRHGQGGGQAGIAGRLTAHRSDQQVLAYARHGTLRVTWAAVPAHQIDGVERYLANTWPPLIGDAFPDVAPIAVNSPWG